MKKAVHYAGFWKRVAVQITEQLVIMIGIAILSGLLFFVGGPIVGAIGAGVLFLAVLIFNIYSYFTKGKTVGDYIMKTKLVESGTHKKPNAGSLFGRFFAKIFVSSGLIVSLPIAMYIAFTQGEAAVQAGTTMMIVNAFLYLWMIFSFGKSGWSNEKQALHDTMSGTRYIEEKQYSGVWTWLANISLVLIFVIMGAFLSNFMSNFENLIETSSFQKSQNFNFEDLDTEENFILTPEQESELQELFKDQVGQEIEIEIEENGEIEVE